MLAARSVLAALSLLATLATLAWPRLVLAQATAPVRLSEGRFTVLAFPRDEPLARSLLASAVARDTFPGLPRSQASVQIAIAPDAARFREWIGLAVPEWGAAVAFPAEGRIVMQGSRAGSGAGDPLVVLRHELAHLAMFEALGWRAPRWFSEGYASYAAGEWGREEVLTTNLALVLRGIPSLARLDSALSGGRGEVSAAYALAHRAVAELAAIDQERGLDLFIRYWRETGDLDRAVRSAYGLTLAAFEERWQSRTRRRYGALALFADLTLFALVVLVVVVPLYVSRRRRDRRRLEKMRSSEEAADRLDRDVAIEELLRSLPPPPPPPPPPPSARGGERGA